MTISSVLLFRVKPKIITLQISSSLVVGRIVFLISIFSLVNSWAASVGKKALELSIDDIFPQTVTGTIFPSLDGILDSVVIISPFLAL